jgi:multiple sugar transport system permease protein
MKRLSKYWNKPQHAAYLFLLPTLLCILLFHLLPMAASFFISLFNITTALTRPVFTGLNNYVMALRDIRFQNAMVNTLLFTLVDVPLQVVFALLVAALLCAKTRMNKWLRGIYFLPIICSPVAIGIMFQIFLHPTVGWFPHFLTLFGLPRIGFFKDPSIALYSVVFVSVWRSFGISMTILVASMQGIPENRYEAAEIDGANKAQQFFHVTVPGIYSMIWFIIITRTIGSLQVFDIVYTITGGGPAYSTETLVSYVYTRAFEQNTQLGYATAMAEWLFFIILLITLVLYSTMNKREKGLA